jgi:hypothetical protein
VRAVRPAVAVALLLVSVPAVAGASSHGCTVLTDAAGDVRADAAPGTDRLPDGHVDLTAVRMVSTGSQLAVEFHVTDLAPYRTGRWVLTFRSGPRQLFVQGERGPADVNAGTAVGSGSRAGVVGSRGQAASGVFDEAANVVRVTAPATAFGASGLRGATLSDFRAQAREVVANVGAVGLEQEVTVSDTAAGTGVRRLAACR